MKFLYNQLRIDLRYLSILLFLLPISFFNQANAQRLRYDSPIALPEYKIEGYSILKTEVSKSAPAKSKQTSREKIEEKPWYVSRFAVKAGGFFPINDTKIEVHSNTREMGTEIDFEDDLNLDRNTQTFLIGLDAHLGKRHRFELDYYRFYRNASGTLDRELIFNDTIYPVNANVSAFFNQDIFRFAYGYTFFSNPKWQAGLSFGLHVVGSEAGLEASGGTTGFEASDDFGFTAPLPDIGIWGGYAFSPKWAVQGEFDYFTLKIGDYDGRILGANVLVRYKILDRLSASLGYTGFNFKLDVEKETRSGFFKWGYNGPSISAVYQIGVIGKGPK